MNTLRLIPYLRNRGIKVMVVVLDSGGYVTNRCRNMGVSCRPLGLWSSKLNFPAVLLRFFLILIRNRPDIVEVYGFIAGMICRFAARPLGVKVVVGIVGTENFHGIRPILEKLTSKLVCQYVTNFNEGKNKMLKLLNNFSPKITVIHNGVPEIEVLSAKEEKNCCVLGTVANLRPEKGYDVMLEALVKVKAELGQKFSIKYLVAGDGRLREELITRINKLDLEEQVELLGMVDNVAEVLGKLDLFVLPSYTEGFPNALLEAMMAGKCVIASRVGGVPEIIEDGYSGLMVEPGNSKELSGAIVKLILNPRWRERMAVRGKELVSKKFSLARQSDDVIKVWTAVCHKKIRGVSR